MKKYSLAFVLIVTVLCGCRKEDDLQITQEKNWLTLTEPKASAPQYDKDIYEFFKQTGIPVFYSDTIGSEKRTYLGQENTYYEVLKPGYTIGSTTMLFCEYYTQTELAEQTTALNALFDKMKREILVKLPDQVTIPSILLHKSISKSMWFPDPISVCMSFKTLSIVLDEVLSSPNFTNKTLEVIISHHVNSKQATLLSEFYQLTQATSTTMSPYNAYVGQLRPDLRDPNAMPWDPQPGFTDQILMDYGFILSSNDFYYNTPTQQEDLESYINAILTYNLSEFSQHYPNAVCIEKYRVLLTAIKACGFKI